MFDVGCWMFPGFNHRAFGSRLWTLDLGTWTPTSHASRITHHVVSPQPNCARMCTSSPHLPPQTATSRAADPDAPHSREPAEPRPVTDAQEKYEDTRTSSASPAWAPRCSSSATSSWTATSPSPRSSRPPCRKLRRRTQLQGGGSPPRPPTPFNHHLPLSS